MKKSRNEWDRIDLRQLYLKAVNKSIAFRDGKKITGIRISPDTRYSVANDGPITINEPTCGSGTMVIGAIWAMQRKEFDYRHNTFFVAQDIDIRCVWMAYIQLSLYGIPAMVIHGNTLTMEEWDRWYTPCALVPFSKAQSEDGDIAV